MSETGLADVNQQIGELLLDLAETYRPSPQYWGYKRASRTIRRHHAFLSDLSEREVLQIPNVGPGTMRIVREVLAEGQSAVVEAAIEKSGRRKEVEERRKLRTHFLSGAMVARTLSDPAAALDAQDHRGDFQMHSRGSDGSDSIAALARGCRARGYRCMAVTDHSYGLPIAGGMTMEALRAQHAEIDRLNAKTKGDFHIFKGVEANLLADGGLDLKPEEMPEFDLVVASPHSALRKTIDQTQRMLDAVSRPGVHILGHPRGRIFNLRAGVQADWEAVFRRASETRVAIELDGDVSRQDLDFELARTALDAGCIFALDSDAHAADQLWMADYAVAHARLAGIPPDRVVNCWPVDEILAWADERRDARQGSIIS